MEEKKSRLYLHEFLEGRSSVEARLKVRPTNTKRTSRVEKRPTAEETDLQLRNHYRTAASASDQPLVPVAADAASLASPTIPLSTIASSPSGGEGVSSQVDRGGAAQGDAPSLMQIGFLMPSSLEGLRKLSEEIMAKKTPLNNIKFTDHFATLYLGLSAFHRSMDVESHHSIKEMCAEESTNRVGALLSRVFTYSFVYFVEFSLFFYGLTFNLYL